MIHLLRMPCPIDCLASWCGEPLSRLGGDAVVGLDDAEAVDCEACRAAMLDTRKALATVDLEEP